MTIGGQPAFGPEKWGPQNATGATEGYSWNARIQDQVNSQDLRELGIMASLNPPGLQELRAAMNQVLDSIRIAAP
jgi:hypothetical protein